MTQDNKSFDVTSLVQDPEALKKMLIAQVRAGGGTQAFDSKAVLQNLVKQTVDAFLEVELEEHLGYAKYAAEGQGSGNSRNGAPPRPCAAILGRWKSKHHATATATSSPRLSPNAKPPWAISPSRSFPCMPAA